jgi:hypothetical protein
MGISLGGGRIVATLPAAESLQRALGRQARRSLGFELPRQIVGALFFGFGPLFSLS